MRIQGLLLILYKGKVKLLGLAYVKLGTSGRWLGIWTGAGVTATLRV